MLGGLSIIGAIIARPEARTVDQTSHQPLRNASRCILDESIGQMRSRSLKDLGQTVNGRFGIFQLSFAGLQKPVMSNESLNLQSTSTNNSWVSCCLGDCSLWNEGWRRHKPMNIMQCNGHQGFYMKPWGLLIWPQLALAVLLFKFT